MSKYKLKIDSLKTIKDTWIDRDEVLLHASFQILKEFVENEKPFKYNGSPKDNPCLIIKELYDWWKIRKELDLIGIHMKAQYIEDDEMLIKLIGIRKHLWV